MKRSMLSLVLFTTFGAATACGDGEDQGVGAPADGTTCTAARDALLGRVNSVSMGDVVLLGDEDGVRALFVDAAAGGYMMQATNPWTYVRLSDGSRVDVTDSGADTSDLWDLAMKRDVIRVNGGDGGPGDGASARIESFGFDALDADDAGTVALAPDEFVDDQCEPSVDEAGKPRTGFSAWYDYDPATMVLTPKPIVFIVRGADGVAKYKLEIQSYYSAPDGTEGMASARYRLRYAGL
jgi:hypothetical protein